MKAYSEAYLNEIVENQGLLFDFISQEYPEKDTKDFIVTYMRSNTRKSIDKAAAYVCTMDARELWRYFSETECYTMKAGESIGGFAPDWMGEFYAYYQWYFDIPSSDVIEKIPVDFLLMAYPGLHDLDLELAVEKVGRL